MKTSTYIVHDVVNSILESALQKYNEIKEKIFYRLNFPSLFTSGIITREKTSEEIVDDFMTLTT